VVEGHRVHGAELAEVVLEGRVVAVPRNTIKWREGLGGGEEVPLVLQGRAGGGRVSGRGLRVQGQGQRWPSPCRGRQAGGGRMGALLPPAAS